MATSSGGCRPTVLRIERGALGSLPADLFDLSLSRLGGGGSNLAGPNFVYDLGFETKPASA